MIKPINKAGRILDKISGFLCASSLAALIAITNIAVFFRYVLHSPLTWSNELATYLLLSFALWGSTMGLLHEKFFAVDIIVEVLPPKVKIALSSISKILIAIFLTFAIFFTRPLVEQAKLTKTLSPAMGIPMRLIYLFLMIGLFFMLLANLLSLVNSLLSLSKADIDKDMKLKGRKS